MDDRKIRKGEWWVVILSSIVIGVLAFFSVIGRFYDIERGSQFMAGLSFVLSLPLMIADIPLYFIVSRSSDPESTAMGFGIILGFLSPLLVGLFWVGVFYLLTKLTIIVTKSSRLIVRLLPTLCIVIILILPYGYFLLGSNSVDACLSGKLNSQMPFTTLEGKNTMVTVGPDACFGNIMRQKLYVEHATKGDIIDFCMGLSSSKVVWGTSLSYRDYCMSKYGQ